MKEAPEEVEKEAIQKYVENGQMAKAVRECEMMGWDDYEKVFEGFEGSYGTVIHSDDGEGVFGPEGDSIM